MYGLIFSSIFEELDETRKIELEFESVRTSPRMKHKSVRIAVRSQQMVLFGMSEQGAGQFSSWVGLSRVSKELKKSLGEKRRMKEKKEKRRRRRRKPVFDR